MYKNIVPSLISFDTKLNNLKGFYFADDFNYFPETKVKNKFHYKLILKNDIEIPNNYDFKNGYFFRKGQCWYYERKLSIFTLKFCYDSENKNFYFNKIYSLIPFEIGHIFPIGRHVTDFIILDLFLEGFCYFGGCAFRLKGKNICILAPSFNGKTSLITDIIDRGGKYIAEDLIILNIYKQTIYPTAVRTHLLARDIDRKLAKKFDKTTTSIRVRKMDKLFLIQNHTNTLNKGTNKNLLDYFNLNSPFYKNVFCRSYIFDNNLSIKISNQIKKLMLINYEYKDIKNFN
jgi:hypothetical protein